MNHNDYLNRAIQSGQPGRQLLCVWVLLALMFAVFLRRQRTRRLYAILFAVVLLLGAFAMGILALGNRAEWGRIQLPAILNMSVALALLSAVFLAGSVVMGVRERGIMPVFVELLIVCAPLWLYGLFCVFTGTAFRGSEALTVSMLLGWFLYQRDEEAETAHKIAETEKMQMTLLQEQMRPHFIFNSLSAIKKLCAAESPLAAEGLDNFAGYLRKNLDALSTSQMILFEKELEHIEQYVALEKLNPSQSFEMVYDLAVIDFTVPALSIQPLVENAIRHGIRSRADAGDGEAMVILTTEQFGEAVRVTVEDNGSGFSGSMTPEQREHAARGLDNVRLRLESQCGGSMELHSDESGTRIVVLIPYRRENEK